MRRIVILAAALVLLASGGIFALHHWSASAVPAQVEQMLLAAAGPGARVSHDPVKFDAWSRTVTISKLAVDRQVDGRTESIGLVVLHGVTPGRTSMAVDRVELVDVSMSFNSNDERISASVPRALLKAFSYDAGAVPRFSGSAGSADGVLQDLARTTAAEISIPSLSVVSGSVGNKRSLAAVERLTISDLKFEGVERGAIKRASAAAIAVDGGVGSPLVSARYGALSFNDIDIVALAALSSDRLSEQSAFLPVIGEGTVGAISVRMFDGTEMTIESGLIGATAIDPSRASFPAVARVMAALERGAKSANHATIAQSMAALGDVYGGMTAGPSSMTNMRIQTRDAAGAVDMTVGKFSVGTIERGKLNEMAMEGLVFVVPVQGRMQTVKLGKMAVRGFDMTGMMRTIGSLGSGRQQLTFEENLQLLSVLEGFEFAGLALPATATSPPVTIERIKLDWVPHRGDKPARIGLIYKGRLPLPPPNDPYVAVLRAMGFGDLAVDLDIGATHDAATNIVSLGPGKLGVGSLGEVTAEAKFTNLRPDAMSTGLEGTQRALSNAGIGMIEVGLRDDGIIAIAGQLAGVPDRNMLGVQIDAFKQQMQAAPDTPPALLAVLDAARIFTMTPGKRLTLRFEPQSPVPAALIGAAKNNPEANALLTDMLKRAKIVARAE